MMRRFVASTLLVLGLGLSAIGVQRWFLTSEVTKVVDSYFHALQAGNRAGVIALLSPSRRKWVDAHRPNLPNSADDPLTDFKYRVHHTEIDGRQASVQMWIEQDGYVIQPVILLVRSETGNWKIDGVTRLDVDPRWNDLEEERKAAQREQNLAQGEMADDQLAQELKRALKGRPGINVDRDSDELPNLQ